MSSRQLLPHDTVFWGWKGFQESNPIKALVLRCWWFSVTLNGHAGPGVMCRLSDPIQCDETAVARDAKIALFFVEESSLRLLCYVLTVSLSLARY